MSRSAFADAMQRAFSQAADAMQRAFSQAALADPDLYRAGDDPAPEVSGLAAWIPASVFDGSALQYTDPLAQLHRVQYSAFCQQWIAIAMAALIGRE